MSKHPELQLLVASLLPYIDSTNTRVLKVNTYLRNPVFFETLLLRFDRPLPTHTLRILLAKLLNHYNVFPGARKPPDQPAGQRGMQLKSYEKMRRWLASAQQESNADDYVNSCPNTQLLTASSSRALSPRSTLSLVSVLSTSSSSSSTLLESSLSTLLVSSSQATTLLRPYSAPTPRTILRYAYNSAIVFF